MLEKDPAKRPDAASVAAELGEFVAVRGPNIVPSTRRKRLAIALVCAGLAAFAIWLAATQIPTARNAKPAVGAPLLATFPATDSAGNEGHPAFSPDGMRLAYDWDQGIEGGNRGICVKPVSGGNPLVLTRDAADDFDPAWSPDGGSIAFLRRSGDGIGVATVPSAGGPVRTVGRVVLSHVDTGQRLLAWSPDGESITVADEALSGPGGLWLASLAVHTGRKRAITLAPEGASDVAPSFSPDGKALAFLRIRKGFPDQLFRMDSSGGPERVVASSDGPVNSFAWSADGRSLVYCAGSPVPSRIWSVAIAGGAPEPAPFRLAPPARQLAIAMKGNHLAFARPLTDSNVWRLGAGRTMEPLLASTREDLDPRYSPDGESIAFASRRTENLEIWVAHRDGSGARQVTWQRASAGSPSWSPNGRQIAFDSSADLSGRPKAIWLVGVGGAQPRRLLDEAWDSYNPSWSRDGVWVYFGSTRGGKSQIWKARFSGGGWPEQVTHDGGFEGYESFDGRDFYYTKGFTTPGVWKMPVGGDAEEEVRGLGPVFHHRYWDVGDRGIYFVDSTESPQLRFFDFATTQVKTVAALPEAPPLNSQAPAQIVRGLSVAPDGREFLNVRFGAERVALVIADLPGR
jgi:Tol biopolymer transport system component